MSFQLQQKIRQEAQQRADLAKSVSQWAEKKNKNDPTKTRKRKRNLPPVRGSVNTPSAEPKEMKDEDPQKDTAARTKPLPPGVVCERYKIEGNNYFKRKEFQLAAGAYSKAIKALDTNPIPWANRAMARLKLKQFKLAEEDCTRCLTLDGTYVKAQFRRGEARREQKKWALAVEDYQQVLKTNPSDAKAVKMVEYCKKMLTKQGPKKQKQKGKKKKILIEVVDGDDESEEEKVETRTIPIVEGKDSSDEEDLREVSVIPKRNLLLEESKPKPESKPVEIKAPVVKKVESKVEPPKKKIIEVVEEAEKEEEIQPRGFIPKTPVKAKPEQKSPSRSSSGTPSPFKRKPGEPLPTPDTFYGFQRLWVRLTDEERYELLLTYDSTTFPKMFGSCLSGEILSQMINAYEPMVAENPKHVCGSLMALAGVQRFEMLLMFTSASARKQVTAVLDKLEAHDSETTQTLRRLYS